MAMGREAKMMLEQAYKCLTFTTIKIKHMLGINFDSKYTSASLRLARQRAFIQTVRTFGHCFRSSGQRRKRSPKTLHCNKKTLDIYWNNSIFVIVMIFKHDWLYPQIKSLVVFLVRNGNVSSSPNWQWMKTVTAAAESLAIKSPAGKIGDSKL